MSFSAKVALAIAAALVAGVWLLGPILAPFVISAGLAYLGDPLVDRLERWRVSRTGGVIIVFLALTAAGLLTLILLAPLMQDQVTTFVRNLPDYLRWIQDSALPAIGLSLPEGLKLDAAGLRQLLGEHWDVAGGYAREALSSLTASGGAVLLFLTSLLLVPVVTFYLLRDWDHLVRWIDDILPRRSLPRVRQLARETDDVLGAFIRGQLLVMLVLAIVYSVGLWLAGLQLALLIGVVSGLVSFVPYLGFIVGILSAGVAMFVQTQEWLPLVWVLLVFGAGQALESTVLTPLLVGDRIGLHPVAVIFAVMAGGQLFGFVGVLLALPAAAVIAVLLRDAKSRWLDSGAYRGGT